MAQNTTTNSFTLFIHPMAWLSDSLVLTHHLKMEKPKEPFTQLATWFASSFLMPLYLPLFGSMPFKWPHTLSTYFHTKLNTIPPLPFSFFATTPHTITLKSSLVYASFNTFHLHQQTSKLVLLMCVSRIPLQS